VPSPESSGISILDVFRAAWSRLSIPGSGERLSHVHEPFERDEEQAMRYLCLVYFEESQIDAMSESEADRCVSESLAYDEELQRSGHLIVAHALESVRAATTVRVRNGRLSTTDGPFAETKEHLGGLILIDARDLNDAIQVASKIPLARMGSIEVRPVRNLAQR
jgi:hypothetical protein